MIKKTPPPFQSSIAIYTYEPKKEDIPEEYSKCGKQITYLKVSCSITGYQTTGDEKQQIADLLSSVEGIDYSKIENFIQAGSYLGCYGVLLNVSVHPEKADVNELTKYPRIIDFEPKVRDFYQAATETGEVLTSSIGKVSTNKSFGTTDQTQSSWNAGATIRIPEKSAEVAGVGSVSEGSPGEIRGDTGQVRTETDQRNWGITTDASRERREGQSTTTQLSQMYNLLTGYHSGTNRASFVMLPRPHILQPTNRRTFVQGLRVIEGIQDFFFIVLRNQDQPVLNVDTFLQTGHFPENSLDIDVTPPPEEKAFTLTIRDTAGFKEGLNFIIDFREPEVIEDTRQKTNPYVNEGFVIDHEKDILEEKLDDDSGKEQRVYSPSAPPQIIRTNFYYSGDQLVVDYKIRPDTAYRKDTIIHRKYTGYVKKPSEKNTYADNSDILITQRKLCTRITYKECIEGNDVTFGRPINPDVVETPTSPLEGKYAQVLTKSLKGKYAQVLTKLIKGKSAKVPTSPLEGKVVEVPFDITPLYEIPDAFDKDPLRPNIKQSNSRSRNDFPFKKGIIRMIHNSMISASDSLLRNDSASVYYLQSKHLQKKIIADFTKRYFGISGSSI